MRKIILLIFFLVSEFHSGQQLLCSAFVSSGNGILLAKNFDWNLGKGLIILNPKGKVKKGIYNNNSRWISKFTSLTFNYLGLQQPLGGMNEAGLTIEELSTWPVDYCNSNDTCVLTEFEWIQYHLDKYSTVEQVVSSINNSSIIKFGFNIHYILADANGDAAVIEFINKKPVIYRKGSLPFIILTNNNYNELRKYLNQADVFDHNKLNMNNSQDRYLKINFLLANSNSSDSIREYISAMDILDSVAVDDTRWSIVYDVTNRAIYLKTYLCNKLQRLSFPYSKPDHVYYYCLIDTRCRFRFNELTSEDNYRYLDNLKNDILDQDGAEDMELINKIGQYLK